jgi:hypothetical protein
LALSALLAAAIAASPARADVLDIIVAGRASQDFGTTFVTGTESGPGAGLGLRASFGDDDVRWEPEVSIDVTGFDGEVDGDPIVEALFLISRRSFFFYGDRGGRPWWSIGAGVGGVLGARGGAAFPARVAIGVSLAPASSVGLEASIFNRFTLVSTSSEHGYINSTGVEIAVRFGR